MEIRLIFEGKKHDVKICLDRLEELNEEISFWCKRKRVKNCKFEIKGGAELRLPRPNELTALFG